MTKFFNLSIQKRFAVGVMVVAMFFGMCAVAPAVAQAQTTDSNARIEAMMAQIQQLMQIVAQLQARVAALHGGGSEVGLEGGFTNYGYVLGDHVQTTDTLKVRSWAEPSAGLVGVQNPFVGGEITGGPRSGGGYTWWRVAYNNGMEGWSAQNWLRKVVTTPPPTPELEESAEEEDEEDYSDVEIQNLDSSAYIHTNSPNFGEWGRFEIEFELTAGNEDLWIKNSLYGTYTGLKAKEDYQPEFSVIKDGRVVTRFSGNFSSMQPGFLSNAPYAYAVRGEKNDNYYVVKAGKTEKFTVDITMTVKESGKYRVQLESPLVVRTKSGNKIRINFDEKDFRSPSLNIDGEDSVNTVEDTDEDDVAADDIPESNAVIDPDPEDTGEINSVLIKANGAQVEFSARIYTRTEAMERCMDVVRQDITAEVTCEFLNERIYDTQKLTKGGQPVVKKLDYEETLHEDTTNPENSTGEFVIDYSVTAKGADVIVPAKAVMIGDQSDRFDSLAVNPRKEAWLFQIEGELGGLLEPGEDGHQVSAIVESNIELTNDTAYIIEEGDTAEFTLTVTLDPSITDEYRVKLGNHSRYWMMDEENQWFDYHTFFLDTDDLDTSKLLVPDNEVVPQNNYFACDRNSDGQYSNGDVACYGVWDYGNSFGGDEDMCGDYGDGDTTGCVIEAPVCESGSAEAIAYYSNRQLESMSGSQIETIANNLDTSADMVQFEMAGLWEYSCVSAGEVQGVSVSVSPLSQLSSALSALQANLLSYLKLLK